MTIQEFQEFNESELKDFPYSHKQFWREFAILMIPAIMIAIIGTVAGSFLSLHQMNQPLELVGVKYLTFELESRNILELAGNTVTVEISSRHEFTLAGPCTITAKKVKIPLAAYNADLTQEYYVYDGEITPGKYQIVSPDYWSHNKGIQFEMWSPSYISVNLSRTDYNDQFGQDSRVNGALIGLVAGLILGFICGFSLLFRLSKR